MADVPQIGMVAARLQGIDIAPRTYAEFLRCSSARRDDYVGMYPGSLAMRGVNRAAGIWCKIPFAPGGEDFVDFEPNDLRSSVRLGDAYGAAKVQSMHWGDDATAVRVVSARALLRERAAIERESREDRYRRLAYAGIIEVKDLARACGGAQFDGKAQARLLIAIERSDAAIRKWREGNPDAPDVLRFANIPRDRQYHYTPLRDEDPPPAGARIRFRGFQALALVTGGGDRVGGTGWNISPVLLPVAYAGELDHLALTVMAQRVGKPLDASALQRFTLAFEHVLAHVGLLQHLRRFVTSWWAPLLETSFWEEKKTAAINFLREWQVHATRVDPLWQLGAGDPYADPDLVHSLALALRLESAWSEECRRVSDLLRFACEIVDDGDPRVLL